MSKYFDELSGQFTILFNKEHPPRLTNTNLKNIKQMIKFALRDMEWNYDCSVDIPNHPDDFQVVLNYPFPPRIKETNNGTNDSKRCD